MLDSLRDFAKSWPGKLLGGVMLVGIAGFGINNVIADFGSSSVAHVGGQDISSRDFSRAYQSKLNQVAQQMGRMPTNQEAESLGVPSQVLQSLAQDAALDQIGLNYSLGVSDDKLSTMLRDDTNFSGTLGNFDPVVFKDVLSRSGVTEADYFSEQTKSARRQQLILSLLGDTAFPKAAADLINGFIGDKRTVDYFVIDPQNVASPPAPTDADLATYLKAHQGDFRTVETRTVQMLALSPESLAATKTITDDAIAAEYDRTKASLVKPETRAIQQVLLTPEQVTTFTAGKALGKNFAALVTEAGLTATEVGTLSKAQVTDPALADAAFGLAQGDFAIIDGAAGKRAVSVSAITAGGQPTLADVKVQIAKSIALSQAKTELGDVQDQIEELRAAFKPLNDIADRFKLKLYTVGLTASGMELATVGDVQPADRTKVADAVFKAQQGKLAPSVALSASTNLWFDLQKVEPARDQTLAEVHDAVVTAWTNEKTNAAVADAAKQATDRLDKGEAIGDVAISLNTVSQLSSPIGRSGEDNTPLDGIVAAAIFDGGPDHHGSAVSQTGDHVVFNVVDATAADGPLDAKTLEVVSTDQRNDLYGAFIDGVQSEAGLRINQQALAQVLGTSQ